MFSVKLSQLVSSEPAFVTFRKPHQKKKYKYIKKLFQNKHLIFEKKFNELLSVIDGKKFPTDKKVLVVFCRFIPTIEILEKRLSKIYSSANVKRMDGRTSTTRGRKELLQQVEKRNQETDKPIIFLVSQVGNEGLDFDNFSDTVIHFDGHYNPAVIDQRNGRVYRRGNLNRKITVKHIYLKETYDQRIKFIELEKRKMKNFFLGDSGLEELIKKILSKENIQEEKLLLKELGKIKFDFAPKEKYLLPRVKKLLK
jgi:SNF2 family DNA or RNA helicase